MPELPEVELFRTLLLPLVSSSSSRSNNVLAVEQLSLEKTPPRKFISAHEIDLINRGEYHVQDVLRKGKLLCMVLSQQNAVATAPDDNDNNSRSSKNKMKPKQNKKKRGSSNNEEHKTRNDSILIAENEPAPNKLYLFLHMGMTGRISRRDHVPKLESQTTFSYPPPSSFLKFRCGGTNESVFSDPRKFGSVQLKRTLEEGFDALAPDALLSLSSLAMPIGSNSLTNSYMRRNDGEPTDALVTKMAEKSMGIKAMLLDQSRIVSGVGNWVADEVLYQTQLHPDQSYLAIEQAKELLKTLASILQVAVHCLTKTEEEFPKEWLFHFRWNKRNKKKNVPITDYHGGVIEFVTSGGRTSAIVPSIQQLKKQQKEGQGPPPPPQQNQQRKYTPSEKDIPGTTKHALTSNKHEKKKSTIQVTDDVTSFREIGVRATGKTKKEKKDVDKKRPTKATTVKGSKGTGKRYGNNSKTRNGRKRAAPTDENLSSGKTIKMGDGKTWTRETATTTTTTTSSTTTMSTGSRKTTENANVESRGRRRSPRLITAKL